MALSLRLAEIKSKIKTKPRNKHQTNDPDYVPVNNSIRVARVREMNQTSV